MDMNMFPVIDPVATGNNILQLRKKCGLTVKDLQEYFGFTEPQAIYKWQKGKTLPSVDNLYALSALLKVSMDQIIVPIRSNIIKIEQQESTCCSSFLFFNPHLQELQIPVFQTPEWRYVFCLDLQIQRSYLHFPDSSESYRLLH